MSWDCRFTPVLLKMARRCARAVLGEMPSRAALSVRDRPPAMSAAMGRLAVGEAEQVAHGVGRDARRLLGVAQEQHLGRTGPGAHVLGSLHRAHHQAEVAGPRRPRDAQRDRRRVGPAGQRRVELARGLNIVQRQDRALKRHAVRLRQDGRGGGVEADHLAGLVEHDHADRHLLHRAGIDALLGLACGQPIDQAKRHAQVRDQRLHAGHVGRVERLRTRAAGVAQAKLQRLALADVQSDHLAAGLSQELIIGGVARAQVAADEIAEVHHAPFRQAGERIVGEQVADVVLRQCRIGARRQHHAGTLAEARGEDQGDEIHPRDHVQPVQERRPGLLVQQAGVEVLHKVGHVGVGGRGGLGFAWGGNTGHRQEHRRD